MDTKMKGARPNKGNGSKFVVVAFWHDKPQHILARLHTRHKVALYCAEVYTRSSDVYAYKVLTYGQALTLNFENQRRLQPCGTKA